MIGRTNVGGGSGSTGATLVVSAPADVTVTAIKDDKTYTRVANSDGIATFKGLSSGTWALSMSDSSHDPTTPVDVIVTTDYYVTLAFFTATINITYPAGSTCKATHPDGTELTAPDTSGTWSCIVPSAGTWTVTATDGTNTKSESVEITSEGQSVSVALSYALILFDNGLVDGITWDAIQQPTFAISNVSSVIEVGGTGYDDGISAIYPMGWRGTTNAINLSTYETLKVTVLNTSGSGRVKVGIGSTATQSDILSGDISSVAESTTTFDISALNDSYFISIYAGPLTLGTFSAKISKVWLE